MSIFKQFGVAFLIFFGVFILYFNLIMALNVTGSDNSLTPFVGLYSTNGTNRWTSDYYFGFESIMRTIENIPSIFNFDNFIQTFRLFTDSLGNIVGDFDEISKPSANFLEALQSIVRVIFVILDVLLLPVKMLVAFIQLNIILFESIVEIFDFLIKIINGTYNTPIDNWSSPLGNYYSNPPITGSEIPPVASVGVSGGVVTVY